MTGLVGNVGPALQEGTNGGCETIQGLSVGGRTGGRAVRLTTSPGAAEECGGFALRSAGALHGCGRRRVPRAFPPKRRPVGDRRAVRADAGVQYQRRVPLCLGVSRL